MVTCVVLKIEATNHKVSSSAVFLDVMTDGRAVECVTGYLLVLHLLVVQALVPLPCGQMLVGQKLVVTIACEVICLQLSLLVSNMLVAVICL